MSMMRRSLILNNVKLITLINGKRGLSSNSNNNYDKIKKSVLISQSNDIYTNLALEDWLYRNYNFNNKHVLLLWKNSPCVVIGRHQNPWLEANVQNCEDNDIKLARRNSGGGTVYHDNGNLNMSFFTQKNCYNRRYNLDIICRALYREWGMKCNVNEREDIVVNDNIKVSGTAAKLGRPNAYHHCTLLVDVNKNNLSMALERRETGITESNATESVRSPIQNLSEINGRINTDNLMSAIGWEYLRTKALVLEDGGHDLVQKQQGFQMINPTEDWFPGLNKLRDEFASWQWNYGRCPKFTVTRHLRVPADSKNSPNGPFHELKLTLKVVNGIVDDIKLSLPPNVINNSANQDASVITHLLGAEYDHEFTDKIIQALGCTSVSLNSTDSANMSNIAATQ